VEAAPISWNGRGYLRLSAQVYNAPAEYDKLSEGIPDLLGVESQNSDRKGPNLE
jgi:isopenicillin-N epimerase